MRDRDLPPLNLPACDFRTRAEAGQTLVLDPQRQRWVVLTPEEWVRLHVVQFLIRERSVPRGLVAVETELEYEGFRRRADIVVYSSAGAPILVVECKAAHITVDQSVVDQVARYNFKLAAPLAMVTNGLTHYIFRQSGRSHEFLPDLPHFGDMPGDPGAPAG